MQSISHSENQKQHNNPGKKSRQRRRRSHSRFDSPTRWRSPAFEILEERAMLSVATDLVSQLTPYQTALNFALDDATSLPLAGRQLNDLPEFNTIFQDSLASIEAQTQGLANGHHQLAIPLSAFAKSFAFDLGLNAFLQVHTSGSVNAAINPVLNVGFNYQNGVATLDALQSNLDVGFQLTLPGFQGTMTLNHVVVREGDGRQLRFSGPHAVRLGRRRDADAPLFGRSARQLGA